MNSGWPCKILVRSSRRLRQMDFNTADESLYSGIQLVRCLNLTLPNRAHTVSQFLQILSTGPVSNSRQCDLYLPIARIRLRDRRPPAGRVAMPEASIYEESPTASSVSEIRASGQGGHISSKAHSFSTDGISYPQFWSRGAVPDGFHPR